MKARVYLKGKMLYADLESGLQLSHVDAVALADRLWSHDVKHHELNLVDWHEDPDHAPLSGQKIAIHSRLRLHENATD